MVAPALVGGPASLDTILVLREITGEKILNKVHADVVANVSRDLRSPLAAKLGLSEPLRGPAYDYEEARDKFLDAMEHEAGRIPRLINDILSLSRASINEHVPPVDTFDVAAVIGEVPEFLESTRYCQTKMPTQHFEP